MSLFSMQNLYLLLQCIFTPAIPYIKKNY